MTRPSTSGEPSLDEYLRKRALGNHVQGASRCFITCREAASARHGRPSKRPHLRDERGGDAEAT